MDNRALTYTHIIYNIRVIIKAICLYLHFEGVAALIVGRDLVGVEQSICFKIKLCV